MKKIFLILIFNSTLLTAQNTSMFDGVMCATQGILGFATSHYILKTFQAKDAQELRMNPLKASFALGASYACSILNLVFNRQTNALYADCFDYYFLIGALTRWWFFALNYESKYQYDL